MVFIRRKGQKNMFKVTRTLSVGLLGIMAACGVDNSPLNEPLALKQDTALTIIEETLNDNDEYSGEQDTDLRKKDNSCPCNKQTECSNGQVISCRADGNSCKCRAQRQEWVRCESRAGGSHSVSEKRCSSL